jgi:hypothetical protein
MDRGRRNALTQVGRGYVVAIVAQRQGIDPSELAGRLEVNRRLTDEVVAALYAAGRGPSLDDYIAALTALPDYELVDEIEEVTGQLGYGFWERTGIVLDGRTDRNHSGHEWEELGPQGSCRLDLFLLVLTLGLLASHVMPLAPTNGDHGQDVDDRGPPSQRDVPLLTAAPSAPPARAGHSLLLA